MHSPYSRCVGVSFGYFEQYYSGTPAHCSSLHRRAAPRGNLAEGYNSRPGCFSATRIGGERERKRVTERVYPTSPKGWHDDAGDERGTRDECESNQPAAPPMAIPAGPPANCSCCQAASYEALSLSHSLPLSLCASRDDERLLRLQALSNFANSRSLTRDKLFRFALP